MRIAERDSRGRRSPGGVASGSVGTLALELAPLSTVVGPAWWRGTQREIPCSFAETVGGGSAPKTQGAAALYRGIEVPGNPQASPAGPPTGWRGRRTPHAGSARGEGHTRPGTGPQPQPDHLPPAEPPDPDEPPACVGWVSRSASSGRAVFDGVEFER